MTSIILENMKIVPETKTFIDHFHSVLLAGGLTSYPKHTIACMSSLAFRMSVQRQLKAISVTAYNWDADHFVAADLLGLYSETYAGYNTEPVFPVYFKYAIQEMQLSLQEGVGLIYWHDQYYTIYGYDEAQQCFLAIDSCGNSGCKLSYETLGQTGDSSIVFMQRISKRSLSMDVRDLITESLVQAIYKWEQHDSILPIEQFACGEQAYDAMIEAIQSGTADWVGAEQTLSMYRTFKHYIARYLHDMKQSMDGLEQLAEKYRVLAGLYDDIVAILYRMQHDRNDRYEEGTRHEMARILISAQQIERNAIEGMKQVVKDIREARGATPHLR